MRKIFMYFEKFHLYNIQNEFYNIINPSLTPKNILKYKKLCFSEYICIVGIIT